ncbi:hypothetical protein [Streptomyces rubellomurinus]|uniref:Uncharacterized protein n=2 Tax=Streptomyces TaxID=1883 RepID=A0A0F2TC47_STRR3|nr:hypothetical protein [Streptomyces rubellomurinus]KJS55544.1 hypothetical protein VM98_12640 [Streptomyces rubellomurinus subsp. indigoferus]KJS59307.1 hypothetical protein VM95_27965 [Streptomyces rubellomurinus]
MSQPLPEGAETIPRPDRTPTALKAALAVLAPDRLPEMVDGQTRAMAEAIEAGSVRPIHAFVAHWAAVVEIERIPESAKAYHRANYLANHAPSVAECRAHAVEVAELYRSAFAAVNG